MLLSGNKVDNSLGTHHNDDDQGSDEGCIGVIAAGNRVEKLEHRQLLGRVDQEENGARGGHTAGEMVGEAAEEGRLHIGQDHVLQYRALSAAHIPGRPLQRMGNLGQSCRTDFGGCGQLLENHVGDDDEGRARQPQRLVVEGQNVADAPAGAGNQVGEGGQRVKNLVALHLLAVHVIGEKHGEQAAHQCNDQRIHKASNHHGAVQPQQLFQMDQGELIGGFGLFQKTRDKNHQILQRHHHKKQAAAEDSQPAQNAASAQPQGRVVLGAAAGGGLVGFGHLLLVEVEGSHGRKQQHHVHSRGLFQIGIAGELQVNVCCQGGVPAADDDGGAEVSQGADEAQQQADPDAGHQQRQNDILENGAGFRAHIPGCPEAVRIQFCQHAQQKHGIGGHKGDGLHGDDSPFVVGIPTQAQQPVGDPAPAAIQLNVGKGRNKGRGDHGHHHDAH